MPIHRGELLEKAVVETNTKKAALARHLKISRNQLYNWFSNPKLSLDHLIKAGKYMNYDFSRFIQEIPPLKPSPGEQENLNYMLKYYELLEKHVQVLEKLEGYEKPKPTVKKKSDTSVPQLSHLVTA